MSGWVPLLAGGLLALTELAFSFGIRDEDQRSGALARLAWAAAAGVGGIFVSALVLLVATANVALSVQMNVVGTGDDVIVVYVLSREWRR